MDKTARTELHRIFLIDQLPEPLTRAAPHIQLFDNYIANTRFRMRSVRDPETRDWTHTLQQRVFVDDIYPTLSSVSEISLNADEHERFKVFEGTEIRKNRYFHHFAGETISFDVYLGNLWGLNTARTTAVNRDELNQAEPPDFCIYEVTSNPFFLGESLVHRNFAEVQIEVASLATISRTAETITSK